MKDDPDWTGWFRHFSTIARYELHSYPKRKKIVGVVAIILLFSGLTFVLGPFLETQYFGVSPDPNAVVGPHYDFAFGGETGFLVLSLVLAVDGITGEFEGRTIEVLFSKPISKGAVYLGKLAAGATVLLVAFGGAALVDVLAGTVMYGPQNDLLVLVAYVAGWFFAGLVFLSMIYAVASFTKSTALTIAITLVYWTMVYAEPNVASFWFMDFLPGWGIGLSQPAIGSGVAGMGSLLAYYVQHPAALVAYQGSGELQSVAEVVARAFAVGFVYLAAFVGLGYRSFAKAQIS